MTCDKTLGFIVNKSRNVSEHRATASELHSRPSSRDQTSSVLKEVIIKKARNTALWHSLMLQLLFANNKFFCVYRAIVSGAKRRMLLEEEIANKDVQIHDLREQTQL